MDKIIVTDLTHFANEDFVCVAGINPSTGECIRPLPYLTRNECETKSILPGSILTGKFISAVKLIGPHREDRNWTQRGFAGACTSEEFKNILISSKSETVSKGFSARLQPDQKHIPIEENVSRSIITLQIDPAKAKIIKNKFKLGRIKFNFTDNDGMQHNFWPVTDLGFYEYAEKNIGNLLKINNFIKQQDELFLRIGLGRPFDAGDGRNGYWFQINGIYTFPDYYEEIRSY